MAKETECQTDGLVLGLVISPKYITVDIELPQPIFWDPMELEVLKCNIHNAMELVFAKYFYKQYQDELETGKTDTGTDQ